jgi:xanthine dehydrogenase iron-sulfur cluster and FAD-binding subunit A
MWETYFTPTSLDQTLRLLAEYGSEARVIAGGTDLILELERGQRQGIRALIDISRIPKLDRIMLDSSGWIRLGPLVTHNHCVGSQLIVERAFALARACWEVGSPQIRNRGTIAGNLVTASPANDSITPLMAFGAQVTLRSLNGERVVPLEGFYKGVRNTVMRDDEMLVEVAFPAPDPDSRSEFFKLGLRRAQAISVVNVAVLVEIERDVVQRARVTLGSVAPTVIHAREVESYLQGERLTSDVITRTGELAAVAVKPIDDLRGSADYRREMARVGTQRTLRSIAQGPERRGYPTKPVMLWGLKEYHIEDPLPQAYEHRTGTPIETVINGERRTFTSGHEKSLLRLLREEGGLTGTKEGCAEGECGACTVYLDGMAVISCLVPAPRAHMAEIVTVEGLARDGKLHPIQQGFIDEGAVQCGYCTPGFLMSGAKLLEENRHPDRDAITQAFTGNLCRCTGYYKIISAVEKAAAIAEQGESSDI